MVYRMSYEEFTDIVGEGLKEAGEALKRQELIDRIKTRKNLMIFYLSLQGILKNAGCSAKANNIRFDDEEQKRAEQLWAEINRGLEDMQALITKYQQKDKAQFHKGGEEDVRHR